MTAPRGWLPDALAGAGFGLLVGGTAAVSLPAAGLVAGNILFALGLVGARNAAGRDKHDRKS